MNEDLKSNLTSPKIWVRLLYMALFAFFLYLASFVIVALVVVQFFFTLLTGTDNRKVRGFSNSLTLYVKDVLLFLTFNSEFKAFPFSDWPAPELTAEPEPFATAEEQADAEIVSTEPAEPEVVVAAEATETDAEQTPEKAEVSEADSDAMITEPPIVEETLEEQPIQTEAEVSSEESETVESSDAPETAEHDEQDRETVVSEAESESESEQEPETEKNK